MKYVKESVMELKKVIFPTKDEMKKYSLVVVATIIASSVFLYGIGVLVLELFSKILV